jgi:hypothetical protein
MNIYLTFDVEIWCDGWGSLDKNFPSSFERYVYGRSKKGEWALPKTLEILNVNGLVGTFFVEPLFSARFGSVYLERIVELIRDAGQEVQLHLHPEWTDEIRPPLIENCSVKRQHLLQYSRDEQIELIAHGKRLLEAAGSGKISSFRAGSFSANRDTYAALACNGIMLDSSANAYYDISLPDLRADHELDAPFSVDGVRVYPIAIFFDAAGRLRPAQVNGASFEELREAMDTSGVGGDFVIVSHNFEMLRVGSSLPDPFVIRRFERLCSYLEQNKNRFNVTTFVAKPFIEPAAATRARTSVRATAVRYVEQLIRRAL